MLVWELQETCARNFDVIVIKGIAYKLLFFEKFAFLLHVIGSRFYFEILFECFATLLFHHFIQNNIKQSLGPLRCD